MKLYIKQKMFSMRDQYNIFDASGKPMFVVESELMTVNPRIHLYDLSHKELFDIKRKVTVFMANYEIYQGDTMVASVKQKLRLFRNQLYIHSAYGDFTLNGDAFARNFEIIRDGVPYGTVKKKWLSWGDSYELNVFEPEYVPYFCSLVIAIDHCLHNKDT